MSPDEYRNFLRASFDQFLQALDEPLEPDDSLLPYEFPFITEVKWNFFADTMIQDELREVTNRLHEWRDMLRRWHAWNIVVSKHSEMPAWDLRREFMEPLMHTSLMMPSAMRDVFTFVGTNTLHQIRLHVEAGYKDVLEGDPSESNPQPRPLTRRQKEDRLARIAAPLAGASNFAASLRQLDDAGYREKTKDYRNANSHAIGPRIALGSTRMVTRRAVPATRMEAQTDGTARIVEVPGKYVASYRFGVLEHRYMEATRTANLGQYGIARSCFDKLTAVLRKHSDLLPRAGA
jgi:hypothetical protein